MRVFIPILAFLMIPFLGYHQTVKEVFSKMNTLYSTKAYKMNYEVSGYVNQTIQYTMKGFSAKKEKSFLVETEESINLMHKGYYLFIDKEQKVIAIKNIDPNNSSTPSSSIDEIASTYKEKPSRFLSKNNGFIIEIDLDGDPNYKTAEVYLTKDYKLTKVIYHLKKANANMDKIVITYKNIAFTNLDETIFSLEKYVSIVNNTVHLSAAFSSYSLIDQRAQKK